jgi:protocatechuate 3,4-dioxygenase beta subunit
MLSPLLASPGKIQANKLEECDITSTDPLGPFYIPDTPFTNVIADESELGTKLFISGKVYQSDCIMPLANALIEVWHADDAGAYHDEKLRGEMFTDAGGNYSFETVYPGNYLNGAQYRPAHIHFQVTSGSIQLITQLYFDGDPYISIDPWASEDDAEARIITLTENLDGSKTGMFDIILDVTTSIQNHTFNKEGFLLQNRPNPFKEITHINFGVFKPRNVRFDIYDLQGSLVCRLMDQQLPNGRYLINWDGKTDTANSVIAGIYTGTLFFDGNNMRSIKMIRQ